MYLGLCSCCILLGLYLRRGFCLAVIVDFCVTISFSLSDIGIRAHLVLGSRTITSPEPSAFTFPPTVGYIQLSLQRQVYFASYFHLGVSFHFDSFTKSLFIKCREQHLILLMCSMCPSKSSKRVPALMLESSGCLQSPSLIAFKYISILACSLLIEKCNFS